MLQSEEQEQEQEIPSSCLTEWEDYFMMQAHVNSLRCRNILNRRGACLVDQNILTKNRIIGNGYSGRYYEPEMENAYDYLKSVHRTVYAEKTAIDNAFFFATTSFNGKDCHLYTTHFPTEVEIDIIKKNGVRKVFYSTDTRDKDNITETQDLQDSEDSQDSKDSEDSEDSEDSKDLKIKKINFEFKVECTDREELSITVTSDTLNLQELRKNRNKKQ